MAVITYKILGQVAPSATTETTLYTVPAATQTKVSSVVVCNRGASNSSFRISASQGGGATANKDYWYYDLPISGNDTFILTVGPTLGAGDIVRVYAADGNLSFNIFGSEIA